MQKKARTESSYEQQFRKRLIQLLDQRGKTAYALSYELGHSKNYISNFVTGRALPPMREFYEMCRALHVTPAQFFEDEPRETRQSNTVPDFNALSEEDKTTVLNLIKRLQNK